MRDFFWDDEFRPKWDPMLAHFKILDEIPETGTMIVHWIKKVCGDKSRVIDSVILTALTLLFINHETDSSFLALCSFRFSVVIENI